LSLDPQAVRGDVDLLREDDPPIYWDNACMTLKPDPVVEAVERYYRETPVCAGRSTYRLASRVQEQVAASREALAGFVGGTPDQLVFTRNTTEAINLVAKGLDLDGTVLTTDREHNSNLVPFQRLDGVRHEAVAGNENGVVDLEAWKDRLEAGDVDLVSLVHVSNLDGYEAPVGAIAELARDHGARVLVDGAQSAPHLPVDVRELGVDAFAWSVHKMMGPTGVGALWATEAVLDELEPLVTGGSTVATTSLDGHELLDPPGRFEAGLQDFGGLVASRAAVEYLTSLGREAVHRHEDRLARHLEDGLRARDGVHVIGALEARGSGVVSFRVDGLDLHELAVVLEDKADVLVRAGLHCLDSWFNARGLEGSCRASLYAYNTETEVEMALSALDEVLAAVDA